MTAFTRDWHLIRRSFPFKCTSPLCVFLRCLWDRYIIYLRNWKWTCKIPPANKKSGCEWPCRYVCTRSALSWLQTDAMTGPWERVSCERLNPRDQPATAKAVQKHSSASFFRISASASERERDGGCSQTTRCKLHHIQTWGMLHFHPCLRSRPFNSLSIHRKVENDQAKCLKSTFVS